MEEHVGGRGPSKLPPQAEEGAYNWKEYHEDMARKMVQERLREAIGRRDRGMLERAIEDATSSGLTKGDEDLDRATSLIKLIDHKKKLKEVLMSNDLKGIKDEIKTIWKSKLLMYSMQREVQEAERYAEGLDRLLKLKRSILDMDKRTMSEVRRYHIAPEPVHHVIQATLLLLGEDEKTTEDWRVCCSLMNPSGPRGMNRKIMDFDVSKVHPEIIARVRQILDDHKLSTVQPISKGTATFYVWATAMIEEYGHKNAGNAKPASSERQRELLGRSRPRGPKSPLPKRKMYPALATPRPAAAGSKRNGIE